MPRWTDEARLKQSEKIRDWKPWEKSTGAKTPEGKAKSAANNYRRFTNNPELIQVIKKVNEMKKLHRDMQKMLKISPKKSEQKNKRKNCKSQNALSGLLQNLDNIARMCE